MDPKKILLIDDNPGDVELTKRALKKSQIYNEIVVIDDGEDAVKYLFGDDGESRPASDMPLVVLMDLIFLKSAE